MTTEQIDDYEGPIAGLLPMLEECIKTARHQMNYDASLELCGATRSAFLRIHDECTFYPDTSPEVLEKFVNSFDTAIFALKQIMPKAELKPSEVEHLEGMISNIGYRTSMLKELKKIDVPIEDRVEAVHSIGTAMVDAQTKRRAQQGEKSHSQSPQLKSRAS